MEDGGSFCPRGIAPGAPIVEATSHVRRREGTIGRRDYPHYASKCSQVNYPPLPGHGPGLCWDIWRGKSASSSGVERTDRGLDFSEPPGQTKRIQVPSKMTQILSQGGSLAPEKAIVNVGKLVGVALVSSHHVTRNLNLEVQIHH